MDLKLSLGISLSIFINSITNPLIQFLNLLYYFLDFSIYLNFY